LHPPNWEHLAFKPKKSLKTTKELQVPPFPILKREKNWALFYKLIKVMLLIKVVLRLSPCTILMHIMFVNLD